MDVTDGDLGGEGGGGRRASYPLVGMEKGGMEVVWGGRWGG